MWIKAKNIVLHVVGWTVFLSVPHLFFGFINPHHHGPPIHEMPPSVHYLFGIDPSIFFFNLLLIAFYYINSFILIPKLLGRRKRLWYILSIIAFMVLIELSPGVVSYLFPMHLAPSGMEEHRDMIAVRILLTTLLFAIIFIVSTGIRIIRDWYAAEQQTEQILLEKTTAELSFLKAQVNPHFLFNTLNNIYSLAVKRSEQTPDAILLLSDMMRYVLSDAQNDHVPLASEISYLTKFIELQKLRVTDMVTIFYEVSGDIASKQIAPLILVPFVENAFKFGISTHEPAAIVIAIDVTGDILKMKLINKLMPDQGQAQAPSGIGQANARKRLSLLYPGRYRLEIDPDSDGNYIVRLEINLSV